MINYKSLIWQSAHNPSGHTAILVVSALLSILKHYSQWGTIYLAVQGLHTEPVSWHLLLRESWRQVQLLCGSDAPMDDWQPQPHIHDWWSCREFWHHTRWRSDKEPRLLDICDWLQNRSTKLCASLFNINFLWWLSRTQSWKSTLLNRIVVIHFPDWSPKKVVRAVMGVAVVNSGWGWQGCGEETKPSLTSDYLLIVWMPYTIATTFWPVTVSECINPSSVMHLVKVNTGGKKTKHCPALPDVLLDTSFSLELWQAGNLVEEGYYFHGYTALQQDTHSILMQRIIQLKLRGTTGKICSQHLAGWHRAIVVHGILGAELWGCGTQQVRLNT